MRPWLIASTLLCLLSVGTAQGAGGENSRFVGGREASFQYHGAWLTNGVGRYTIYPGSQVCFCLKGRARLAIRAGMPDTIHAQVRSGGTVLWDGLAGQDDVAIEVGTSAVPCSVVYLATNKKGYDPALPDATGAEFGFQGLTLDEGAALIPMPETRGGVLLDFTGDSITVGECIAGRSGSWVENSNATLTYAFQLAEKLHARYRMRAFAGARCDALADRFVYFRKSVPLAAHEAPDIVFVNIGANDRAREATQYRAELHNFLEVIFKTYPKARVVLLNFCRMTPNRLPVLKELSAAYPSGAVTCFDARPYLVGYSDKGVHPDVESHRRLAEALAEYVTKELLGGASGNAEGTHPQPLQGGAQ